VTVWQFATIDNTSTHGDWQCVTAMCDVARCDDVVIYTCICMWDDVATCDDVATM